MQKLKNPILSLLTTVKEMKKIHFAVVLSYKIYKIISLNSMHRQCPFKKPFKTTAIPTKDLYFESFWRFFTVLSL